MLVWTSAWVTLILKIEISNLSKFPDDVYALLDSENIVDIFPIIPYVCMYMWNLHA